MRILKKVVFLLVRAGLFASCIALSGCYWFTDFEFKQVHSGLNGPIQSDQGSDKEIRIFESAEAIESSWIKRSLTPIELAAVLKKVDFKREFIYAFRGYEQLIGTNGANKLTINNLMWTALSSGVVNLTAEISVEISRQKECTYPPGPNYPFAIAVVKRLPSSVAIYDGGHTMYFPEGKCLSPTSNKN